MDTPGDGPLAKSEALQPILGFSPKVGFGISGFSVQGLGFQVRVQGSRLGVWGLVLGTSVPAALDDADAVLFFLAESASQSLTSLMLE